MPSVAEIKAELKRLKIRGITGKKKAELLAMLPADSCMRAVAPKRRKAPARSPSPEPVPVKATTPRKVVARAVPTPAAVMQSKPVAKTIEKPGFVERNIPGKKIKMEKIPKLIIGKKRAPRRARVVDEDDLGEYFKDSARDEGAFDDVDDDDDTDYNWLLRGWLYDNLDDALEKFKSKNKLTDKKLYSIVDSWFNDGTGGMDYYFPMVATWLKRNE
jgi:hypothetical protein